MRRLARKLLTGKRMLLARDLKAFSIGICGLFHMLRRRHRIGLNDSRGARIVLLSLGGRFGSPMLASELAAQGYEVHVISRKLPGHEIKYCCYWHRVDCLGDFAKLLAVVRKINPTGIASEVHNVLLPVKAKLISEIGLRSFGDKSPITSTSKFAFRKSLDEAGIGGLQWHPLNGIKNSTLAPPYVIKPDRGKSSMGIYFIENDSELNLALDKINSAKDNELVGGEMIVEKFIKGRQFDVEGVSRNSKCYPLSLTEEHYDQVGFAFPTSWYLFSPPISEALRCTLLKSASNVVQAAGVINGCWHCEMRVSSQGEDIIPLDYSNRMGYPKMVSAASGESFFSLYISTMFKDDFSPPYPKYDTVYQRFIESESERSNYLKLEANRPDKVIEFRKQNTVIAGVERYGRVSIRADNFDELDELLREYDVRPVRWDEYYGDTSQNPEAQPVSLYHGFDLPPLRSKAI